MYKTYMNINGNSNVKKYEILVDSINVIFKNTTKVYTYSYKRAGIINVENMKKLAERGYGLNSYINLYCKYLYN